MRGVVPFLFAVAIVAGLAVGAANLVGSAAGIGGGASAETDDTKSSPPPTATVAADRSSGERRTSHREPSNLAGPSTSSPTPPPAVATGPDTAATHGATTPDLDAGMALAAGDATPAAPKALPSVNGASPATSSRPVGTDPRRPRLDPDDAEAVQTRLVRLRYLPRKAVTGSFDSRTAQAVMAFQSWQGIARDGVVGKQTARALVTAQPPRPAHEGEGRWLEVHRDKATVLVVQDGRTLRAVHASTGQTGDDPPYATPAGDFAIYAKQLKSWSVPYEVWMPYAMYFNGGIALHGSDAVPPYPASHGCVRLPQVEAPIVYGLVSNGTPVYVY